MAVPVLFATSGLLGARAIRLATWSSWSHVALLDVANGTAIEAVWPRVREVPIGAALAHHTRWAVVCLPGDADRVLERARSQIGKPYDLEGTVGLGFHRDWQDDNAWWCSELVEWCFEQEGFGHFRPEVMHRITPQHLWMLAPEHGPPYPCIQPLSTAASCGRFLSAAKKQKGE